MKITIAIAMLCLLVANFAKAAPRKKTVVDCKVAKLIDDNIFEEGLSRHEYPEVYIEANTSGALVSASVGAMIDYDVTVGDTINKESPKSGSNRYYLKYKKSNYYVLLTVNQSQGPTPTTLWGNLYYGDGHETQKDVAILICKK
jgi:hypothetical protein